MAKWHARVAHTAKHMNMVDGPVWWGTRAAWAPFKSDAARHRANLEWELSIHWEFNPMLYGLYGVYQFFKKHLI